MSIMLCILIVIQVCEDAKRHMMIVRALNYNMGLQDFTVVFFCSLTLSAAVMEVLSGNSDFCQLAVCAMPSGKKGMYNIIAVFTWLITVPLI